MLILVYNHRSAGSVLHLNRQLLVLNDQPSEINDQFFANLAARRPHYQPQTFICDQFATLQYQEQFQLLEFPFHQPATLDLCAKLSELPSWALLGC